MLHDEFVHWSVQSKEPTVAMLDYLKAHHAMYENIPGLIPNIIPGIIPTVTYLLT